VVRVGSALESLLLSLPKRVETAIQQIPGNLDQELRRQVRLM
jgi:hypothetical protein